MKRNGHVGPGNISSRWAKLDGWEAFFVSVRDRSALVRYLIATGCVTFAFITRYLLPGLHDRVPLSFFIVSAMVSAAFGGFWPGMYALALGLALGDFFFMPPPGLGHYGQVEWFLFFGSAVPALLANIFIELLHRARRRVNARSEELMREIAERKRIECELQTAQAQLQKHAVELEKCVSDRTWELQQSVRVLEDFCHSMAHNLRAPLRAVRGLSHALEEDYAIHLDARGKDYMHRIAQATCKMDKLILDLLDYGRVSGKNISFQIVDLDYFVPKTVSHCPEVKTHQVDVQISHPLHSVWSDPTLIGEIFSHLISNAATFSQRDVPPTVKIWAEDRAGEVRLWIKDNGVGVDPKYHQKIFGLFETLETSTSTTGTGLALAAKAVERLKGFIGVESERGKGCAFWIELPKPWKTARDPDTVASPQA